MLVVARKADIRHISSTALMFLMCMWVLVQDNFITIYKVVLQRARTNYI